MPKPWNCCGGCGGCSSGLGGGSGASWIGCCVNPPKPPKAGPLPKEAAAPDGEPTELPNLKGSPRSNFIPGREPFVNVAPSKGRAWKTPGLSISSSDMASYGSTSSMHGSDSMVYPSFCSATKGLPSVSYVPSLAWRSTSPDGVKESTVKPRKAPGSRGAVSVWKESTVGCRMSSCSSSICGSDAAVKTDPADNLVLAACIAVSGPGRLKSMEGSSPSVDARKFGAMDGKSPMVRGPT
mmetsp:Transcript_120023/g.345024  ORF Transcript_120023/g.345024 Transcript_120023/m.345024 type:complete len:238 (+) Transcript_120023:226-939(+)